MHPLNVLKDPGQSKVDVLHHCNNVLSFLSISSVNHLFRLLDSHAVKTFGDFLCTLVVSKLQTLSKKIYQYTLCASRLRNALAPDSIDVICQWWWLNMSPLGGFVLISGITQFSCSGFCSYHKKISEKSVSWSTVLMSPCFSYPRDVFVSFSRNATDIQDRFKCSSI